jgi:hypothetical protein
MAFESDQPTGDIAIRILDICGKLDYILHENVKEVKYIQYFDISSYMAGIYFVEVETKYGIIVFRILKINN